MRLLIFDSGPLISLTLNGLLHTLELLKEKFPQITFIITPQVKREVIDQPLKIKKYELEAIKIQNLLDKKILVLSSEFVQNNKLSKETAQMLSVMNTCLRADKEFLKVIQEGEASCLAFSKLCNAENLIVVDERATRLFSESPENLRLIMEKKFHMPVSMNIKNLKELKNFKFIRSTELAYVAYKNNLYDYKKDKTLLDAILYSLKYSGTTISSKEIEEMKSLG